MKTSRETTTMEIPLAAIEESPLNARRLYRGLEELAESIRSKGVIVPLMVRPGRDGGYQLVTGHRRVRAAKLAGLETVPATVRDLSDEEVIEIQIIENIQRSDVTPIEETAAYEALVDKYHRTVEDIAAKVGKSPAYVYQRMRLAALPKEAKDAVAAGALGVSVALAIARLPGAAARKQAASEVLEIRGEYSHAAGGQVEKRMSSAEAVAFIRARYTLRMSDAGFDLTDASLVPKAGACAKCPKCSSNTPQLFPELADKDDLCTDPDCFAAKRDATWKRTAAAAESDGKKVLDAKKTKEIFGEFGHAPHYNSDLITLGALAGHEATGSYESKKSWKAVLGKLADELRPAVARAPDGTVVELVSRSEALAALKRAGKLKHKKPEAATAPSAADKKARAKRESTRAASDAAIARIVSSVETDGLTAPVMRLLAETSTREYGEIEWLERRVPESIESLRGKKGRELRESQRRLALAYIATASERKLSGIIVEEHLRGGVSDWHPISDELRTWCRAYGIALEASGGKGGSR